MKKLIDPKERQVFLSKWHGSKAKIWVFHVSRRRMAISVSKENESDCLYIVAVGCKRISGPFDWSPTHIEIVQEPPNQWGELYSRIVDAKAGFDLLCSDVVIASGPGSAPNDPFDGFFEGK